MVDITLVVVVEVEEEVATAGPLEEAVVAAGVVAGSACDSVLAHCTTAGCSRDDDADDSCDGHVRRPHPSRGR